MTQDTTEPHIAWSLMPKYCGRCGLLIQADEEVTKYEHSSASAGGTTVYLHTVLCKRLPSQTCPSAPGTPATGPRRSRR